MVKHIQKIIIIILITVVIFIGVFLYFNYSYNFFNKLTSIKRSDELTIEEIKTISRSIAAIQCYTFQPNIHPFYYGLPIFGSGAYLTIKKPFTDIYINVLLTNAHIAENPKIRNPEDNHGNCNVVFNQSNSYTFFVFTDTTVLNNNIDFALLNAEKNSNIENEISPLNQKGKPMPFCKNIVTGMKVYIFGYPGSSDAYTLSSGPTVEDFKNASPKLIEWIREIKEYNKSRNLILTEGIISGKRGDDYFTTAKIDTGNSGGLAVAKENGEICLVGIPTWVSIGEVDNLGIIQPIQNIYDSEINWNQLSNRIEL